MQGSMQKLHLSQCHGMPMGYDTKVHKDGPSIQRMIVCGIVVQLFCMELTVFTCMCLHKSLAHEWLAFNGHV